MGDPSKRLVLTVVAFVCALLLLSLTVPSTDAAQLKAVSWLKVVDANNKLVGVADLSPGTGNVLVVLRLDKLVLPLIVKANQFSGNAGGPLWFESTDCSGSPWMYPPDDTLLTQTIVALPGNTVYTSDPAAVPQSITVQSYKEQDGSCWPFATNTIRVPAQPVIDLFSVFTPPFSVR